MGRMTKTKRPMTVSPSVTGCNQIRGATERKTNMTPKFMTAKGAGLASGQPYYIGHVQHDRAMSKREAYEYLSQRTGFRPAQLRAAFLGLRETVKANAGKGNASCVGGVAAFRNVVKGSFETLHGPWMPGVNMIVVNAFELDPFKSALAGFVPANRTEGANPVINTVLDEVTHEYDTITGTDTFSIAGADLAPDTSKVDEYVALVSAKGVETKCEITFSDLQNVKAKLADALEPGEYTLKVYTRSGMGEGFGVRTATRKVTVA